MMNSSQKALPGGRRRLFIGLLVMVILAGAWITYFLHNFDLNDYRKELEGELSSLISLPVRIDNIHYNLHETNLALHLSGLQIGDETSVMQINAPDTMIDLQWRGLLAQEFRFIRISLTGPEVWVRHAASEDEIPTTQHAPFMMDQAILHNTSIGALDILNGTVHIETRIQGIHQNRC